MSHGLDHLDPSTQAGQVYEELVQRPRTAAQELATGLGLDTQAALRILRRLAQDNLVLRTTSSSGQVVWEAVPPGAASRERLQSEDRRLAEVRHRLDAINELYWLARGGGGPLPAMEVLPTRQHIHVEHLRLQRDATRTIRALDRPPYVATGNAARAQAQRDVQRARMAAGVDYRVVYQTSTLEDPALAEFAREWIPFGERVKQAPALPMKLTIADDERALMSLEPRGGMTDPVALLVYPSALLDGLMLIFEHFWVAASPLDGPEGIDERTRTILALLAAGSGDDHIAHQTGLSKRTVARAIADILERVGAKTRFQAGLHAQRAGWL